MAATKTKKHTDEEVESDVAHDDESRTVFLVGAVDEELIKGVVEKIIALSEKAPTKPIHLIINTVGGEVDDTFMLYDLMKYVKTPIYTVGLGKIMSAGCLLLAAGKKGKRKMGRNARIMYHGGYEVHAGSIWEMEANLKAFKDQETQYDLRFADETGLTLEQVEKLYDRNGPTRDHYIDAHEALKLGIIDTVI